MLREKIIGLVLAIAILVPVTVNASTAATTTVSNVTTCTASNMTELKECMSGKNEGTGKEYDKVTKITISDNNFIINENININNYETTAGTKLTINNRAVVTLSGNASIAATTIEVNKGTLNITTSAATALSGTLDIKSGIVNISADTTKGNAPTSENTAIAVNGNISIDNGTFIVKNGNLPHTITSISGKSTVEFLELPNGSITVVGDGETTVTADKIGGGVTVNGTSKVTVTAKEIGTSVNVNNLKAVVKYANDNIVPTVTKGLAKKNNIVSANVANVLVYTNGLTSVELADNEVLVINDIDELENNFKIVAENGAKIDNKTNIELTLTINEEKVVIGIDNKDDDAYIVNNKIDKNEEPTNPENPSDTNTTPDGDVTIDKNPATDDSIMSYIALAVSSIASLGLAIKKFLF